MNDKIKLNGGHIDGYVTFGYLVRCGWMKDSPSEEISKKYWNEECIGFEQVSAGRRQITEIPKELEDCVWKPEG